MMDRKQEIQASYKQLGEFGSFYDKILLRKGLGGKLANTLMWGFNEETTAEWIGGWRAGIPDDFLGKLLEVPVGTGVLTMPVYQKLPDAEVTCLDYSTQMMGNAKKRAEAMGLSNVSFLQGDVGKLPFPDESFDIVLSLNGFHAFPDKEAAYSETFRVLKKGGIFCGCFYTEGGSKRTDWVTKHIFVPKGAFTPPFETAASLRTRLSQMYTKVDFKTVRAEGIFVCRK